MKHFFQKPNWYVLLFSLILIIAASIRFSFLGSIPAGLTVDEAAIGYNGYAVITARRDEWLQRLPISFQSFGDYKAPFAIYLTGIFVFLFGSEVWVIRLPFAIFSLFTVAGMMLLSLELYKKTQWNKQLSLITGVLMTFSPWHVLFSRTGFESGIALCFVVWGIYLFLLSTSNVYSLKNRYVFTVSSVLLFALSLYTYHSTKVVVPLLLLSLALLYSKELLQSWKMYLAGIIFGFGLLYLLIKDSFFGEGLTRASTSILFSNITVEEKISTIFKNFLAHFSFDFLVRGKTDTLRHGTGVWGVLLPVTYIFTLLGLGKSVIKRNKRQIFLILWLLFGILPAAIGKGVPHSNRALLALPAFILLAVEGIYFAFNWLKQSRLNQKKWDEKLEKNLTFHTLTGTVALLYFFTAVSFLSFYFGKYNSLSVEAFSQGYLEAAQLAYQYEKGINKPEVKQIIFTDTYKHPYIYLLFVRRTNPIWYRGGSLSEKYLLFSPKLSDLSRENTLIVAAPQDEIVQKNLDQATELIYATDGTLRFIIYKTD